MQRIIFIGDTKYQKSVTRVLSVSEAQDIVNKFRFAIVMLEFEIPVLAFNSLIDEIGDGRK